MRNLYSVMSVIMLLSLVSLGTIPARAQAVELFMPDGQMSHRPVRVYVSGIEDSLLTNLKLHLVLSRKSKTAPIENNIFIRGEGIGPGVVARDQQFKNENDELKTGTLLVFNLGDFEIPSFQPGERVLPVLRYGDGQSAVSDREVYIGYREGALMVTIIAIAFLVIFLNFLSKRDERYLLGILSTADGRMSVSHTQVFLWTVAIGSAVLIFAITRLHVPPIPDSLWILMGISATTGVTGHLQTDWLRNIERRKRELNRKEKEKKVLPSLKQLIMVRISGEDEDADLSKAQLLFWTLITIGIFIHKSFALGEIWDVPDSLLALMGISQAGYVTRKQFHVRQERKELKKIDPEEQGTGSGQ